jgi:hypothetical protein
MGLRAVSIIRSPRGSVFVRFDKSRRRGAFCHGLRGFQESKGAEMSVNKHTRHHGGSEGRASRPDWRRLHHSRLFWVGLSMMLLAITIYVLSDDLAWRPRIRA